VSTVKGKLREATRLHQDTISKSQDARVHQIIKDTVDTLSCPTLRDATTQKPAPDTENTPQPSHSPDFG
jgi:hypothetical protein